MTLVALGCAGLEEPARQPADVMWDSRRRVQAEQPHARATNSGCAGRVPAPGIWPYRRHADV